jgi:parallel beta-helix repeat protein
MVLRARIGAAGLGRWRQALGVVTLAGSVLVAPLAPAEAARPQPTPAPAGCVRPVDNLVVAQSVTLCPGTYNLSDRGGDGVIQVKASGVTVDGTGVVLQGSGFQGYGIHLDGQSNVTIRNFAGVAGYYYGMRLQNASGLTVLGNVVSNNYTNKGRFLNINAGVDAAYGGGILVNRVNGSIFQKNRLTGQSSGLDLYDSSFNTIGAPDDPTLPTEAAKSLANDASNNSVWGIKLYRSSDNVVRFNRAHDVNRTGDRGGDSAGVLLTNGSNRNRILDNVLTFSGDGFFIGNQHSVPSNGNTIARNDGSGSPNNCFEATFSANNTFEGNRAANCNYGFWLGYSHDSLVRTNTIMDNRTDGINIDRGYNVVIERNQLLGNDRNGVQLTGSGCSGWNTATQSCTATVANNHSLTGNTVKDNAQSGLYALDTTGSTVRNNLVVGNNWGVYVNGASTVAALSENSLLGATSPYDVYNNTATMVVADRDWWGTVDANAIAARLRIACSSTNPRMPPNCNVTVTNPLSGPAPGTSAN